MFRRRLLLLALAASAVLAHADDGYHLWLRYDRGTDQILRAAYATAARHIVLATPADIGAPQHNLDHHKAMKTRYVQGHPAEK